MIEIQVFDGILRCLFTDMVMLDWSDINFAELSTAKLATLIFGNCTNSPKLKVTAFDTVQMAVFDFSSN